MQLQQRSGIARTVGEHSTFGSWHDDPFDGLRISNQVSYAEIVEKLAEAGKEMFVFLVPSRLSRVHLMLAIFEDRRRVTPGSEMGYAKDGKAPPSMVS